MQVRWAPGTNAWFRQQFGEEVSITDVPLIRSTLQSSDLVTEVNFESCKREHPILARFRRKFPKLAPKVLRKLEATSVYQRLTESALELRPTLKKNAFSVGGELDRGKPVLSLTFGRSFFSPSASAIHRNPILVSAAARAGILARERPHLQIQVNQPVIRDLTLVDTRAFSIQTENSQSFWWTDAKQKLTSRLVASTGLGSVSLNNGARLQLVPRLIRYRSPWGDMSIHPRCGISLRNSDDPNAVLSVETRYHKYLPLGLGYYLENRLAGGVLHQTMGTGAIPLDEFLSLGGGQDPVRGKPFERSLPTETRTEGARYGIAGSLVLGRRGIFHPRVGAFGFVDSAHTSTDALRLVTGVGVDLQLTGGVAVEGSVGVSPVTGSPVWDMRVNANF